MSSKVHTATPPGPALAAVELTSIARSWRVVDAMIKQAPAQLWRTTTLSTGRFLILLAGGVAEVDESYHAGLRAAGDRVLDKVFLPQVDPQVQRLLLSPPQGLAVDALGVLECSNSAAALRGADAVVKSADVQLIHLHLGQGIGGKAVFGFTGALHDVQAGLELGIEEVGDEFLLGHEEIPAPHGAMTWQLLQLASTAPDY